MIAPGRLPLRRGGPTSGSRNDRHLSCQARSLGGNSLFPLVESAGEAGRFRPVRALWLANAPVWP